MIEFSDESANANYRYDYKDSRKFKRVVSGQSQNSAEAFYIDEFSELRGSKLIKYAYAGPSRIARSETVDDSEAFVVDAYYLHDHLGSTNLALANEGIIREQMVHWPFGLSRKVALDTSEISATDYRFTGKEKDRESELLYFDARYYNPISGTFVGVDEKFLNLDHVIGRAVSISKPIKLNTYAYVGNSPFRYIDPNGLDWTEFNSRYGIGFSAKAFGFGASAGVSYTQGSEFSKTGRPTPHKVVGFNVGVGALTADLKFGEKKYRGFVDSSIGVGPIKVTERNVGAKKPTEVAFSVFDLKAEAGPLTIGGSAEIKDNKLELSGQLFSVL